MSVGYEMIRSFDIDWCIALHGSRDLELAVSQRRVVDDEVLFNECELAAETV